MRTAPALRRADTAANVLTIDLEDWFHICGAGAKLAPEHWDTLPSRIEWTTRWLLDVLDATGSRATFFVVGWIAERFPGLVQEVMAAGHDIGSHSHMHQLVYTHTPDSFRADLRRSVAALHAAGVSKVTSFRAPEWSINDRSPWALEVLASEGFQVDASMAPVRVVGSAKFPRQPHWRTTTAGQLYEVPPLVADWAGHAVPMGWGWGLRMSRPARVLAAIDAANRAGAAAVLMIHPWEIDPQPPRMRLPARLHFAHYFRLEGFGARVHEILKGASFGPVADIVPAAERCA